METLGKILPDGTIEKEYSGNGFIYKNPDAFYNSPNEICYVSELDKDNIEEGVGWTYKQILELAQKFIKENKEIKKYCGESGTTARQIAENIFDECSWESPATIIDQWLLHDSYTE